MAEWSHAKKWWMDVLKNGVTLIAGAVLTFGVLQSVEDAIADRRSVRESRFMARAAAMKDFRDASIDYIRIANLVSLALLKELNFALVDNGSLQDFVPSRSIEAQMSRLASPGRLDASIAGAMLEFPVKTTSDCLARTQGLELELVAHAALYGSGRRMASPRARLEEFHRSESELAEEVLACVIALSAQLRGDPFGDRQDGPPKEIFRPASFPLGKQETDAG